MDKNEYIPIREIIESEELGFYVTYGISARRDGEEIAFVSDVSTDRQAVEMLAHICTVNQLSTEHLNDVIEDFLSDLDASFVL